MSEKRLEAGSFLMDFLVISIISISTVSIVALVINAFNPTVVVFSGLAISTTFCVLFQRGDLNGSCLPKGYFLPLLAVIFLALIFRAEPFPWIHGGQDQGLYVSMSSYYQHGGKVFIEDNSLNNLPNESLKKIYKKNIRKVRKGENDLSELFFQPGVFYGGDKDYVFQFYHLHPLWMALFAEFFGDDARWYSLTFFSILSIIFLMLLTIELSGSNLAGLMAGVLLAINPLHVFFSKWPVTEITALAFTSIGIYYLIRSYRLSREGFSSIPTLIISSGSLSLMFFVRISGFLYLPLLLTLILVGIWLNKVKNDRFGKYLVFFSISSVFIYFLSFFYGLIFSPEYSKFIYNLIFGRFLADRSFILIFAVIISFITSITIWFLLLRNSNFVYFVKKIDFSKVTIRLSFLIGFFFALFNLYKVYKLGYTNAYIESQWYNQRWHLSGSGIQAIQQSTVLNWLIYTSPFMVVVGVTALLKRKINNQLALLVLFVSITLIANIYQMFVIPYQYYYARYLLSEAVPYGIVVATAAIFYHNRPIWKKLGIAAFLCTVPLFVFYSYKQIGAEEGVRPLAVLRKIAAHIEERDYLLIDPNWPVSRFLIETPLRFYFGLNTFVVPKKDMDMVIDSFASYPENIWLLSPTLLIDDRFTLIERQLHYDKVMERSGGIPKKIVDNFMRHELFLYWLNKDYLIKIGNTPFDVSPPSFQTKAILGDGWHNIESSHVWSSEQGNFIFKKSMFAKDSSPKAITIEISAYAASQENPLTVTFTLEDQQQKTYTFTDTARTHIQFPLPSLKDKGDCHIEFSADGAVSPHAFENSADTRVLGVALYSFSFD